MPFCFSLTVKEGSKPRSAQADPLHLTTEACGHPLNRPTAEFKQLSCWTKHHWLVGTSLPRARSTSAPGPVPSWQPRLLQPHPTAQRCFPGQQSHTGVTKPLPGRVRAQPQSSAPLQSPIHTEYVYSLYILYRIHTCIKLYSIHILYY